MGGRIIFERIFKFEWEEVESFGLVQNGDNLCAFVNPVVNISFPKLGEIFVLNEKETFFRLLSP